MPIKTILLNDLILGGLIAGIFTILGTILGHLLTKNISVKLMKKQWEKEDKENIYSPLFTELQGNLKNLKIFSDVFHRKEWDRINKIDFFKIPGEIYKKLGKIYDVLYFDYDKKEREAKKEIVDICLIEFEKRHDGGYTLEASNFMHKEFFKGKLEKDRNFTEDHFNSINSQLENKYKNLEEFFEKTLKILNKRSKIKDFHRKHKELIKSIKDLIEIIGKRLR